jgi:hypothetical protein
VSSAGNRFLRLIDRKCKFSSAYEITFLEGRFSEEYTRLANSMAANFKVCGCRTENYLNWRYRENPLKKFEILALRHHQKLLAYAIFHQVGQDAVLADLFGIMEPVIIRHLLASVIEELRQRDIVTVSTSVLDGSPLIPLLKQSGFYARESSPWVVYTKPGGYFDGVVNRGGNWFLTNGDRDV